MAIISVSLPSDGQTATAEQYNGAIDAILAQVNGNLDSTNIASVSGADITAATIPPTAMNAAANQGWIPLTNAFAYSANNGNKEFVLTYSSDLTSVLSVGMKLKIPRSITPATTCMAFASASSQYASNSSPSGISFTGACTCEAWIYPTSYGGSNAQGIISRFGGTNGFLLALGEQGQIQFNASSTTYQQSYQSVSLNQWTHVAATFSSGTIVIYINGIIVPSYLTGSGTSITQSGSLQVGAYNSSNYFNGYISEARIWAQAQSQSQIQQYMYNNCVGTETGLVACFEGNSVWTDKTSNANTLTAAAGAINNQTGNPFNATEYAFILTNPTYSTGTTTIKVKGVGGGIPNQTLGTPSYSTTSMPYGWPSVSSNLLNHTLIKVPILGGVTTTSTTATAFQPVQNLSCTIPSGCSTIKLKIFFTTDANSTYITTFYVLNGSTVVGQINSQNNNGFVSSEILVSVTGGSTFTFNMNWQVNAGTGQIYTQAGNPFQGVWLEVA